MRRKYIKKAAAGALFLTILIPAALGISCYHSQRIDAADMKMTAQESESPVLLSWPQNLNAVRSEVEIFGLLPEDMDDDKRVDAAIYRNDRIYSNKVLIDASLFPKDIPLFWRVRAYDLDGNPTGPWSQPAELESALAYPGRNAPLPNDTMNHGSGTTLLYPVYSYTPNPGASRYEVEVLDQYPEKLTGHEPSRHRIYADVTTLSDLYDQMPRIGTYYWRVRGMDDKGLPVGEWSLSVKYTTAAESWKVAVYGDSISHGGGHLSFSPVDFAYSYESYFNFPSINLSQSGDTSEMMVERFERDVTPFHPKYLLIMGGTNSLRAGVPAKSVIEDLKIIQKKSRENGIIPILLTLPPINPGNIEKAFNEPTYEGWRESFRKVNDFIRREPHIDVARPFENMDELPTWLALDGIHGDWNMKKIMGNVINKEISRFMSEGYSLRKEYKNGKTDSRT